jgi:hypothetical protein
MPLPEQKKKLLKAKIAVALYDELGRVPIATIGATLFAVRWSTSLGVTTTLPNKEQTRKRGGYAAYT